MTFRSEIQIEGKGKTQISACSPMPTDGFVYHLNDGYVIKRQVNNQIAGRVVKVGWPQFIHVLDDMKGLIGVTIQWQVDLESSMPYPCKEEGNKGQRELVRMVIKSDDRPKKGSRRNA